MVQGGKTGRGQRSGMVENQTRRKSERYKGEVKEKVYRSKKEKSMRGEE